MAKKKAGPQAVETLVQHALRLAATSGGKAKWLGKSNKALFNENEENTSAAIERCLDANRPLLKQTKTGATVTAAGFEEVAGELAEDQVVPLAKGVAATLTSGERVEFLQAVIGRTPLAGPELLPVLEEAVAAEKAEQEARVAAAAKTRAAEEAARKVHERALQLIEERRQNRLDALRREWEAEGQKASELPALKHPPAEPRQPEPRKGAIEPRTAEEKDFRRDVANQLAAAWRAAWEANKHEARDYLESAMWNISGLKLVGEPGERVAYTGRYHDSVQGVASGDQVRIVRPGWALDEGGGDYVVLKAVIEK